MYRLVTSRKSLFQSSLNGYSSEASGLQFQSTLPHGSDALLCLRLHLLLISIHAPSRERLFPIVGRAKAKYLFQSTFPYGSDKGCCCYISLMFISIHAPLRERPRLNNLTTSQPYFNPRSLARATALSFR